METIPRKLSIWACTYGYLTGNNVSIMAALQADGTKRAALLLRIKKAFPQVFTYLTTQPGRTCDEITRTFITSASYLTSDIELRVEDLSFEYRI